MAHEHALWAQTTLGEVATVTMGQAPPSSTVSESAQGIPFIQGNGEFGFRYPEPAKFCAQPARVAEPGDILVSVRAPVGALNIARQKLGIGRGLAAIKVNNAWPEFLWYALQSSVTKLNRVAQGSTFHAVNRSDLEHLEIRLPSLPKQRKIAAILSSVDETIEKTETVIEQLQVVKKAMMRELLMRGLPGRHTRFRQTELGQIPESWAATRLREVCRLSSGGTPDRGQPRYWGGSIPWVKTGEINYSLITATEEKLTEDGLAMSSAKIFPSGTVVMAMYGQGTTRGRVAILGVPAATNQACLAFLDLQGLINSFLFHILESSYDRLRSFGNEGAQKNLSASLMEHFPIAVPPVKEQKEIATILSTVEERIATEREVLKALHLLKSALLQALLTGQIRVTPDEPSS